MAKKKRQDQESNEQNSDPLGLLKIVERWKTSGYLAHCDEHGNGSFVWDDQLDGFRCPVEKCEAWVKDGRACVNTDTDVIDVGEIHYKKSLNWQMPERSKDVRQ